MYSFDNPLKRGHHFRELSLFLQEKLDPQLGKGEQQCKSKFSTIRRKIKLDKVKGKKHAQYCFVDYLMERGKQLAKENPSLYSTLARLEKTLETDSPYMLTTRQLLDFEQQTVVQLKNNSICGYLHEIDLLRAKIERE